MVKRKSYKQKPDKSRTFILKDKPLTVYKSGNSNVVTIPAYLDIKAGDSIKIEKINILYNQDDQLKKDLAIIDKLAGTLPMPEIRNMSAEELDDFIEGVYD